MRIFLTVRRVVWAVVLGSALLLCFLPRMLSSKWVYSHWVDRFRVANFQLQIDHVSLRWLSPIRIDGVSVRQLDQGLPREDTGEPLMPSDRNELIHLQSIESSSGLLGLIFSGEDLGTWTIDRPTVDVQLLENGTNLQSLIQALRSALHSDNPLDESQSPKRGRKLTVVVREAKVDVKKQGDANPLVVVPAFDTQLTYLGNQPDPQLEIEPTQWLNHVKLTPQLMDLGLQLALPSLANATWLDGEVSLATEQAIIPLRSPLTSRARAVLTLHNVRAGVNSQAIKSVAQTMGRMMGVESDGEVHVIDEDIVVVNVSDGAVEHSGFRFGLPKVDPELQVSTSGQVHLMDHRLEAELTLPIPLKLLARKESVRDLGIPTVALPIRGTLEQPQIDWTSMRGDTTDLLGEIGEALGDDSPIRSTVVDLMHGLSAGSGDEAIGAAAEMVGDLRARLKQRREKADEAAKDPNAKQPSLDDEPASPNTRSRLRDRLRRIGQPSSKPDDAT